MDRQAFIEVLGYDTSHPSTVNCVNGMNWHRLWLVPNTSPFVVESPGKIFRKLFDWTTNIVSQ